MQSHVPASKTSSEKKEEIISRLPLPGHPTVLSKEAECEIVEHLLTVSEWGFPFDNIDLRMNQKTIGQRRNKSIYIQGKLDRKRLGTVFSEAP